jgi:hypothetical protein
MIRNHQFRRYFTRRRLLRRGGVGRFDCPRYGGVVGRRITRTLVAPFCTRLGSACRRGLTANSHGSSPGISIFVPFAQTPSLRTSARDLPRLSARTLHPRDPAAQPLAGRVLAPRARHNGGGRSGYLGLLAEVKPEKLERAAVRWHGRLELEATLLQSLRGQPDTGPGEGPLSPSLRDTDVLRLCGLSGSVSSPWERGVSIVRGAASAAPRDAASRSLQPDCISPSSVTVPAPARGGAVGSCDYGRSRPG